MELELKRGRAVANPSGGLRIWRMPAPGREYMMGVDTSAGVRGGDFACAHVLDAETGEQCAEYHGLYRATPWGTACARLGWLYNGALIAIETHPSQHGLRAWDACYQYGYGRMWMQQRWDAHERKYVPKKGWVRTPGSTSVMLERVRDTVAARWVIHSEELLDELAAVYLDTEKGKIESSLHDDRVMAYAIACIMVYDGWRQRAVETPLEAPPEDLAEQYWRRQEAAASLRADGRTTQQEEFWNGA